MGDVIQMAIERPSRSWKIVVHFERRDDGGLRAWCDEIPGFGLSHTNADLVLADVQPALEGILTYQLGERYITTPLSDIRAMLERNGVLDPPTANYPPEQVEYVAQIAA